MKLCSYTTGAARRSGSMPFAGDNITVRNCFSHHNEDGWFATRDADYILVEDCEIGWNGTLFQGQHNATRNDGLLW